MFPFPNMAGKNSRTYMCVHCGNRVPYLFKRYSPTVLKLENCDTCQQVADKYIEYDLVIVMIDLVLLNREAYRHVLFNSPFKNHWKLAVVLILVEVCTEWTTMRKIKPEDGLEIYFDVLDIDQQFYLSFLRTIIGDSSWWLSLFCFSVFLSSLSYYNFVNLWKAMVLANCSKFLVISQLIWGDVGSPLHSFLINAYVGVSQIQALSVVCRCSRLVAAVTVAFAVVVKFGACLVAIS